MFLKISGWRAIKRSCPQSHEWIWTYFCVRSYIVIQWHYAYSGPLHWTCSGLQAAKDWRFSYSPLDRSLSRRNESNDYVDSGGILKSQHFMFIFNLLDSYLQYFNHSFVIYLNSTIIKISLCNVGQNQDQGNTYRRIRKYASSFHWHAERREPWKSNCQSLIVSNS